MAASRLADGRYGDGYVASDHALAAILRYRSPFDDFVQGLSVPRKPRTRIRKCPGDAWLEAARRAAEDEATQEHEVAEALFDLANMFAAAEPVLEAEEAATNSPPAGRAAAGGGHRAKRARNAKTRAAAEPVFPSRTSARNHAAHHSAHNTASGFQDALARQADAAVHDYGLAAQLAANAHAADAGWDRRSPANGLTQNLVQGLNAASKLGNPAALPNNGGFAPNGLPSGLAGFYPPSGALPPGLGAPGSAWGALPAPSDDRSMPKAQLPAPLPPAFSVPQHSEHRFPRCASHVYIAHFIEYQSKLEHQRQAAGLPSAGHYEGFYQPGAQAPPGFPGGTMPQQNGNASHNNYKGAVKQEPQQQQQQQPQMGANGRAGGPQLPQMSGSLSPFGGPGPVTSGAPGSGRGPPGAAGAVPSAAALQQQQQAYAAQLSQLAMLSQQSGAAFSLPSMPPAPPFLQPPGGPSPGGMPSLGGMGGLNAQQAAAAAAAAPFFSQQGFNLASLLPPGAMAQLASTSSGMQMDLKDGLLKQSPSAPRLDDLSALLPPNASREDVQAWAMKNLYANGNGGAATSQPQQQPPHQQHQQQQASQQQQQQQQQQQHRHQQGQGRQQNGQQQHSQQQQQQQQQQQGGNGGGGSKNSYQLAEAQLKQFHEAFANAERERKLRTAGIMDGHGMPPNIIDPAGGGSSTRITLAHH